MTNKENMKKIIIKDFDKKSNHNVIVNKIENKCENKNYLKYAIVPIILVIITSIIMVNKQNNNKTRTFKDNNANTSNISTTSNKNNDDYDGLNENYNENILVNELKEYKNKQDNSSNYLNNINIPYFEILKGIDIPDDFDILAEGRGVCVSKNVKDKDYGKVNNYELWYKNSKNNRNIIIALPDKNKPYRDFQINRENSNKTIINGVEVEIYQYKNTYVSIFSYKGYNFDIESCDIIKEEYIRLLYSLIK